MSDIQASMKTSVIQPGDPAPEFVLHSTSGLANGRPLFEQLAAIVVRQPQVAVLVFRDRRKHLLARRADCCRRRQCAEDGQSGCCKHNTPIGTRQRGGLDGRRPCSKASPKAATATRAPGCRIVDAGCNPAFLLWRGIEDGRRERSHRDRHADTDRDEPGQNITPITSACGRR